MDTLKLIASIFLAGLVMFTIVYIGVTSQNREGSLIGDDVFSADEKVDGVADKNHPLEKSNLSHLKSHPQGISTHIKQTPVAEPPNEKFLAIQQEHPDVFYDAGPSAESNIEVGEPIWPVTQKDIANLDKRFEKNLQEIERIRAEMVGVDIY